jgi:hypothetical protein
LGISLVPIVSAVIFTLLADAQIKETDLSKMAEYGLCFLGWVAIPVFISIVKNHFDRTYSINHAFSNMSSCLLAYAPALFSTSFWELRNRPVVLPEYDARLDFLIFLYIPFQILLISLVMLFMSKVLNPSSGEGYLKEYKSNDETP